MDDTSSNTYYAINRPPDFATVPAGAVETEVWPGTRQVPGTERFAHGFVTYASPLPYQLVWKYELLPADPAEQEDYWDWRDEVGL